MNPAGLNDDDPGITSWAGVSDAVAEMRAALAAAEARAERAEAALAELGLIVQCARCSRKTLATHSRTPGNPELDVCPQCAIEVGQEVVAEAQARGWAEGEASGWSRAMRMMSDEPTIQRAVNPYQQDSQL